jgi:hypothetical protein
MVENKGNLREGLPMKSSGERMKEALMAQAEAVIDELIAWHEGQVTA